MTHSEKHGINSPQLYGSRKNTSTQEAFITLRVIYDMARMDRCHMILLFNDLAGCYDRVRLSLNTITVQRMRCTKEIAVCHAQAVRQMKHRVRPSAGISKDFITWCQEINLGGIGQGNGAGPQSFHSLLLSLVEA